MGDLRFDGVRRATAKRPIETGAHRRVWDDLCSAFLGARSSDIAKVCGVSRQTASAWLNHPEDSLTWERFEQVARAVYDYIGAHPGEVRPERFEQMGYGAVTQDDVAFWVEVITGTHDTEDKLIEEFRERIEALARVFAALDDSRQLTLQRIATDMLTAQSAERKQRCALCGICEQGK